MKLNTQCMCCIVGMQEKRLKELEVGEVRKAEYLKAVFRLIGESEESCSAPLLVSRINRLQEFYFGQAMDYTRIKQQFNSLMGGLEKTIEEKIGESRDSLEGKYLPYLLSHGMNHA